MVSELLNQTGMSDVKGGEPRHRQEHEATTCGIITVTMSQPAATASPASPPAAVRAAMLWGIVVGLLQAATPLVFWWLDSATVYAFGLVGIAFIYVGFA